MTITLIAPFRAAVSTHLISTCTGCDSLIWETAPGVFEHIGDTCKECFGTGHPCPYPEMHGVHERFQAPSGRTTCTTPEPHECLWCRRVLDAAELPCTGHRDCCGCCDPF